MENSWCLNMADLSMTLMAQYAPWFICACLLIIIYYMASPTPVYMLDFACFKPDDSRKCPGQLMLEYFVPLMGVFTPESIAFCKKVFFKSGVGEEAYSPPGLFHENGPQLTMQMARLETHEGLCAVMDEMLKKTGVDPQKIGILIVQCSGYHAIPSLSAMIVNKFKLGMHVLTYNLSGMTCSAGVIAMDLAKHLLQIHKNTYAVILTNENVTNLIYRGNDRPMLVSNCLFRVGAAGAILTNRRSERSRCKYKLVHSVRIHKGADDRAYNCVQHESDEKGNLGIKLTKDVPEVAADALRVNFTKLGPLVLPYSEQLRYVVNLVRRRCFNAAIKPYIPQFNRVAEHILLHPGGRAVLDSIQRHLNLSDVQMEPARMTLYRFGNMSSSSTFYELAYVEAKERVRKGDRVFQLGIGAGFKCNTIVWKALRNLKRPTVNPWLDAVDNYPVKLQERDDIIRYSVLKFKTLSGEIVTVKAEDKGTQ